MGMFDYLKIDPSFEIELPKELLDLGIKVDDLVFQTKSMDKCLCTYTLKQDGLYKTCDFFENKINKPSITNVNFHGIIDFGTCHQEEFVDYLIDYEAKFTDGKLISVTLKRFQEIFHESKNKKYEEYKEKIRNKSLLYKLLIFIQNNIFVKILNLFFACNSFSLGVISFGNNSNLNFYFPTFIIGYEKYFFSRIYGVAIRDIDTELTFSFCSKRKEFCIKILGLGFRFIRLGALEII